MSPESAEARPFPLRLFAVSAAVLLAAYLPKLVPNAYSTDDYILLHGEAMSASLRMYVAQGRFGMALLHAAFTALGASPVHSYTLLHLASVALLALSAVLLVRLWDLEEHGALPYVVGPLAFVHPFLAETWSFRIAPIYFSAATALSLGGLWLIRRGRERTLLGMALIAASLSIYQVGLNPLVVALVIGACLDLWRVGPDRAALAAVAKVWALTLLAVLGACLAYFLAMKLVLLAVQAAPDGRAGFVVLAEVPRRVRQIFAVLPRLLGEDRQLSTTALYALQLALLAATVGLAAIRSRAEGVHKLLLTLVLLFAALLACVGLHGAIRFFQPWPRSMTGAGIFWSGAVALCALLAGTRRRGPALAAAALLGLGFIGLHHRAAAEQMRLNARELALAGRVLERLDAAPGGLRVRRIAAVGHRKVWSDLTTAGDLNVSALYIPWSQAALIAEVAGRQLGAATTEDRTRAEQRCSAAPKWPAEGAVIVDGDLGILCF